MAENTEFYFSLSFDPQKCGTQHNSPFEEDEVINEKVVSQGLFLYV